MNSSRATHGTNQSPAELRRAFTLMEVMIAVGILCMCLFGILALVGNSLATARNFQQHRAVDTSTVAGLIYVTLSNTNQVNEGSVPINLKDTFPGYKCDAELTEVDFFVAKNNYLEVQSHFYMYLPALKQGMSKSLPQH
jgi:Tfp pilus assembly protein PilV